jgi:hypothetical protein
MSIIEQITAIQVETQRLLDERDEAVARAEHAEKENGELLDELFALRQEKQAREDAQRQIRELSAARRRTA